jgi:glyoxylase-like metal-dependent hydrolase (beta-lactamase superfamily II)
VVRAVTATHGHPDHVGGAGSVAARHNAPIYLPATTMSYFDGVNPRTPSMAKLARTWQLLLGQPFDGACAQAGEILPQQDQGLSWLRP